MNVDAGADAEKFWQALPINVPVSGVMVDVDATSFEIWPAGQTTILATYSGFTLVEGARTWFQPISTQSGARALVVIDDLGNAAIRPPE
jgi:hypothetical protein